MSKSKDPLFFMTLVSLVNDNGDKRDNSSPFLCIPVLSPLIILRAELRRRDSKGDFYWMIQDCALRSHRALIVLGSDILNSIKCWPTRHLMC